MKKYLKQAGYFFKEKYDDLLDKEFHLTNVTFEDGVATTQNNFLLDRVETYTLHLDRLDPELFSTKLETAIASAISAGVDVSTGNSITAEKVENGFEVTMSFYIKGK